MPTSYDFKTNDTITCGKCFLSGAYNFKVMEIEVFKLDWDLMIIENILKWI